MHGVRMDVRSFARARARVHELETTAHYVNRHEFRVPGRRGWSYAEFVDLGPVPIDVIVAQMRSVLRKSTRFRDVPLAQAHDHWRDAAMKGKGSPFSRLRQWTKEKVTCFLCIRVGLRISPLLFLLPFLPSMYVSMLRIVCVRTRVEDELHSCIGLNVNRRSIASVSGNVHAAHASVGYRPDAEKGAGVEVHVQSCASKGEH